MSKLFIVVAIIFAIYYLFFRKKRPSVSRAQNALEMISCNSCKTFVAKEEAVVKQGKEYCCECAKKL